MLLLQLRLSLYATLLIKFRGERHVYRRADVNLQTKHLTVQTLLLHLSPWTLPGSVNLLRGQFEDNSFSFFLQRFLCCMALQAFIEVFSRISWDSNISSLLLLSLNASIFLSLWPGCYNFCCSSCQELPIDLSFMYSWWRFYQTTQTERDVYKTKKSLDVPQSIAYTHTSLSLIYHEASILMHYFYHERMKI